MINSDLRLFLALGIVGVFVEWQSAHAQVPMTSFNDFYQSSMTSGLPQIPNNLAAAPELGETSEQIAFNSLSSRYPWKLNIGLTANYSYNSNINAMPNGMRGDTFTQSGFLQAAYGAIDTPLQVAGRFVLGYKKYLAHSAYDGQTDDLDLSVNWKPTEKFSFTFSIGFVDGLGSMLGSGAQTSTSSITTNHSGRYQIDEKLSTGYNLSFNALLASSSMNYSNENVALFLDYQLGSKMQLGLSAGSGFRSINGTEIDSNFGIHGAYQPTEKLNINEAIALGVRSYSMGSDSFYPSIQIGAQYYLRDQTGLNLSLFNSLGSGLLMNSVQAETQLGFTLGVTQQIIQKLTLNFFGGYQVDSYSNNLSSAHSLSGGTTLFGASLAWKIFKYIDCSIFSNDLLNRKGPAYDQFITGAQVTASF